jgi:Ca2+-binding EF-hand superfamily protein
MRSLALALVPATLAGLAACGPEGSADFTVDDSAVAAQALIDEGDTLDDVGGVVGAAVVDDDVAAGAMDPTGPCAPGALRARVMARYDDDGDGVLSGIERAELRADVEGRPVLARRVSAERHLRRAVLARLRFVYDENRDGVVDELERALLRDDLHARCEARHVRVLERYDEDGSGDLSEAERQTLIDDVRARAAARRAGILERFDDDGDGRLSDAERAAVREAARSRAVEVRHALVAQFDDDGDGRLSDAERQALTEHLRARFRLEVGPEA